MHCRKMNLLKCMFTHINKTINPGITYDVHDIIMTEIINKVSSICKVTNPSPPS